MKYKYYLQKVVSQWNENKKFVVAKLKSLLVNVGILKSSEYVKFIILGRSRTGSNYLRSLLNSHPNVLCYGEVFREVGVGYEVVDTKKISENKVFHKYASEIKSVGFKLFYYHANTTTTDSIWKYLIENNVKVIHITRKNMLETVVSRKRSELTDAWTKKGENIKSKEMNIELHYDECLKEFEWTEKLEAKARELFSQNPVLEVTYEDLSSNPQEIANQICEFLGVSKVNLITSMQKQNNKKMSDVVSNYSQVKEQFKNTKWEKFFTD